jgi:excisionase family DNA binding protein
LCFRQPAIIEEWCERPDETNAQRNGSISTRPNFRRVEGQQPIEPTLLLIQCAVKRLKPGERAIERAFLFAKGSTGCGPDGERTIRGRCGQIEQQRVCWQHGAAYELAAILAIAQRDVCSGAGLTRPDRAFPQSERGSGLPKLLTVDDAADLLRTTRRAIHAMIERRQLPGVIRLRRRVPLRADDLLDWLDQKRAPSSEEL